MIKELLNNFLPPHEIIHCEAEKLKANGDYRVAGIAIRCQDGLEVFGSSSSTSEDPLLYAAYELLERYAVLTSKSCIPFDSTENTRYSISNGVALHKNSKLASESAYLELIERNEVLKSWYLNTPIKNLPSSSISYSLRAVLSEYDFQVVNFSTKPEVSVVGVFAFSKEGKANIYGFGSAYNLNEAVKKAEKEFLTRLGFVGEEAPVDLPFFSNTPDYHQDFYLHSRSKDILLEWLNGEGKSASAKFSVKEVLFEDLTPKGWTSFNVIRAKASDYIPLFFGVTPRQSFDFTHRCDIPHPVV